MKTTTLYCTEGRSDKVYQATLREQDGGWVVDFAYGRRGSTLATGTKTQNPVSLEQAERINDKLVREKTAKGYRTKDSETLYAAGSQQATDIRPQLLNPVEEAELESLLQDDGFLLQPKLDGKRLLVLKKGRSVVGINRRGIECGIPVTIQQSALALSGDFLMDGEAVGDTLHCFDLLEWQGEDLRCAAYKQRLVALLNLLASGHQQHIRWVTTNQGERMKRLLLEQLREERAEGIVFKRHTASFQAGRPARGGDQVKFKFVETASVVVSAINDRRSVAMAVMAGTKLIPAGNVTIPPNHPMPEIGQVAEVRYLYAMPGTGALYQPIWLGVRDDIVRAECTRAQLKYKTELKAA